MNFLLLLFLYWVSQKKNSKGYIKVHVFLLKKILYYHFLLKKIKIILKFLNVEYNHGTSSLTNIERPGTVFILTKLKNFSSNYRSINKTLTKNANCRNFFFQLPPNKFVMVFYINFRLLKEGAVLRSLFISDLYPVEIVTIFLKELR